MRGRRPYWCSGNTTILCKKSTTRFVRISLSKSANIFDPGDAYHFVPQAVDKNNHPTGELLFDIVLEDFDGRAVRIAPTPLILIKVPIGPNEIGSGPEGWWNYPLLTNQAPLDFAPPYKDQNSLSGGSCLSATQLFMTGTITDKDVIPSLIAAEVMLDQLGEINKRYLIRHSDQYLSKGYCDANKSGHFAEIIAQRKSTDSIGEFKELRHLPLHA